MQPQKLNGQYNNGGLQGFQCFPGNLLLSTTAPSRILHADGVINITGTSTTFHYHLKDHLGNIRSVITPNQSNQPVVVQANDYYPFGMVYSTSPNANKYLYNGKEQQDMPGKWLDYGWRMLDPQLGRWHVVDPMAKKYYSITPYAYVANNPIYYVDPDGRDIVVHREKADNGAVTLVVTVTGKLINESGATYKSEQLQGFADRLASSIVDSYSGTGENVSFRGMANITVATDDNPLSETDHAFRIVDQGKIPDGKGGFQTESTTGAAAVGHNVVYISEHILDRKEATEGKYAGAGKTEKGTATFERTGPHELGHSGGLSGHPKAGTFDGNLMHQTKQPNAGKRLTEGQILKIEKDYKDGNLNKGLQKF
ncbi:MAG: RHS repeat-associated core domain-containing protein [Bacteroidales bacterium]|nr:RHS repeat-associated core domain-containing protein [Bacteroidales bacterium]